MGAVESGRKKKVWEGSPCSFGLARRGCRDDHADGHRADRARRVVPKQWTHPGENIVVRGLKQSKAPSAPRCRAGSLRRRRASAPGPTLSCQLRAATTTASCSRKSLSPASRCPAPATASPSSCTRPTRQWTSSVPRASITLSPIKPSRSLERGRRPEARREHAHLRPRGASVGAGGEARGQGGDEAHERRGAARRRSGDAAGRRPRHRDVHDAVRGVRYGRALVVPAFAVGTAMAATAAAMGEKSLERGDFDAFPS